MEREAAEVGHKFFDGEIVIAKELMKIELKRDFDRNSVGEEDSQENNENKTSS